MCRLAEEGDPTDLRDALQAEDEVAGTYELEETSYDQGAIVPGKAYLFDVEAFPGDRLHLASMLVNSNDQLVATPPEGIELFDGRTPRTGDVTASMARVDAGTEENEPLGEGDGQPLVGGHDVGVDTDEPVSEVTEAPDIDQIIAVSISIAP